MSVVPRSKVDTDAAERAVAAGWPAVASVMPELLEWMQDYNWPVSRALAPFLASIGEPLVPYLRPILMGDDAIWKYWIVVAVVSPAPVSVVEGLRPELERLVEAPSERDVAEDVPAVALAALDRAR